MPHFTSYAGLPVIADKLFMKETGRLMPDRTFLLIGGGITLITDFPAQIFMLACEGLPER